MKNSVKIPVVLSTLLLLVYALLFLVDAPLPIILSLFSLSPIFIIWTVYAVLRKGEYRGKELEDEEEWAYEDRRSFYR